MSKADIDKSLETLHAEIGKLKTSEEKDKLLALIADVEQQMQNPDSEEHKKATQNLPGLIEQFEAEHPKVTDTLGRLLTTLSGMGI